jgi:hypothetical protein
MISAGVCFAGSAAAGALSVACGVLPHRGLVQAGELLDQLLKVGVGHELSPWKRQRASALI